MKDKKHQYYKKTSQGWFIELLKRAGLIFAPVGTIGPVYLKEPKPASGPNQKARRGNAAKWRKIQARAIKLVA